MARVNVYLPDDLAEEAKASSVNISRLTQEALRRALKAIDTDDWLDATLALGATGASHEEALQAVIEAKNEFERVGD